VNASVGLSRASRFVTLGSLIRRGPQNGLYKPQTLYGDGTPIIRIDDFDQDGRVVSPSLQKVRISTDELQMYALMSGDILINRVNSLSHLGKAMMVGGLTQTTIFESNMMRFALDGSRLLEGYLIEYLSTERCKACIRGKAKRAVAQSSINQGDVCSIHIPMPSPDEQKEIATVLTSCGDKVQRLENETLLVNELSSALAQELTSGTLPVSSLIGRVNSL
jgi:type I restriction enzyme S subunit